MPYLEMKTQMNDYKTKTFTKKSSGYVGVNLKFMASNLSQSSVRPRNPSFSLPYPKTAVSALAVLDSSTHLLLSTLPHRAQEKQLTGGNPFPSLWPPRPQFKANPSPSSVLQRPLLSFLSFQDSSPSTSFFPSAFKTTL